MNKFGIIKEGNDIYSYAIGENPLRAEASHIETSRTTPIPLHVSGYTVYPFGQDNQEPTLVRDMISGNRLLPELIEKQIRMLYGNGPMLYRSTIGKDGKVKRVYLDDPEIRNWLESWRELGLSDDFSTYINKCIRSFYYTEGIFTKWRLSAGGRSPYSLPVAGLEHLSETRCRLCSKKFYVLKGDLGESDFPFVMVGNWLSPMTGEFKVFRKMDYTNPLGHSSVVSYSKNPSFGEEIYAFNVFFNGIKEWIHGSNLSPVYINDYLENAMSARLHIVIPNAWMNSKRTMLEEMCSRNAELEAAGKQLQKISFGEGEEPMEVGTEYSQELLTKYTNHELRKLTSFLSGRGKNQGKVYASQSFINDQGVEERWKIEEVPQKYKEYIEAIKMYDERADQVMLSSKGLDSSISNVAKDGVVSKSGSDAYYNYMIYLNGLTIPETVVCRDINYALKLNFPEKYNSGIRIGFYRPAIEKQQNVNPENRMTNQEEL